MNQEEKKIMEEYAQNCNIEALSYEILGKMLDEEHVEQRLNMFGINNVYIYGGTYLAVQLCRVSKKFTRVKGVVDKAGRLPLNENIPVLTLDELRQEYNGENIIITPLRYIKEIKKELETFVNEENLMDVGEFMLGLV